ncbi:MAG: site-specific DNA-methyltransferase, partial [Planctomycetaceae bacterium]|nr:site-specific DNA-methyltransferase [Planctomycetaceae bacterium]
MVKKAKRAFQNTLYTNDNLYVLSGLNSGFVDLIYLDPPFNTKRLYTAPAGSKAAGTSFKDTWTRQDVNEAYLETLTNMFPSVLKFITAAGEIHGSAMTAYLTFMAQRIVEMRRILKDTGTLYLHCDPTASHYLKIVLDGIFGKKNFVNEIVWHYHWGLHVATRWNRKHDIILMYAKTGLRNMVFNAEPVREAYSQTSKMSQDPKWNKSYNDKGKLPEDVWYIPTINAMS